MEDIKQNIDEIELDENLDNRYLTFKQAEKIYAIEVKNITEIIGYQSYTKVPNIKSFIIGIINLRGNIIPIISARQRFEIEEIEYSERACIIVLNYESQSIGVLVDEVFEVTNLDPQSIEEAPITNKGTQSKFIKGIGKSEKSIYIIIDLKKFLFSE
jgi:purine-binding chemotaxis protein CheW